MLSALGTTLLRTPTDVQVIAYNFPAWHRTLFMERYLGKGWTEYDVLKNAHSLFAGHSMPHYPLWGYYDESDPVWAAREVDLAATYGVDAWMMCWYWHQGEQIYREQSFLKAPNRNRLKFAIMWANADWKSAYPGRSIQDMATLSLQRHSLQDFEAVTDYCCEHYFSQPNYLKIDGKSLFGFFDGKELVKQLGTEGVKRGLNRMRQRSAKLGMPDLHLQANQIYDGLEGQLKSLGCDSATLYGTFGWSYGAKPAGSRIPYGTGAYEAISAWEQGRAKASVPFHPTCSTGWDDSPRFETTWPFASRVLSVQ